MQHNMDSQVIGEMTLDEPYQFTYVYSDNRRNTFDNIVKFQAMKTGCYVLFDADGVIYVIRPTHEYVIERPQPKANK